MEYNTPYHSRSLNGLSFLVTGGAGFIGSHLVQYLLEHDAAQVRVLDNLATGLISNVELFSKDPRYSGRYEFINGDIRDVAICRKACEGIDLVTHQAAMGSVPRSLKDPATTNAVNVTGFLNMLIALIQRLTIIST